MAYNLFFQLIQVAIGRRDSLSRVPSADEWSTLYKTAQKLEVAGVCSVATIQGSTGSCMDVLLRYGRNGNANGKGNVGTKIGN